jgi:DNA (cytosine-5)-methyltransferase 1
VGYRVGDKKVATVPGRWHSAVLYNEPVEHPFTAVDLFAGCGALTLGLKQAGFKVVLAVELDPAASASYRLNHPEVRVLDCDIRSVDLLRELRKSGVKKGELDLLAACPPCQGFSTMRTLNEARSVADNRNDLVSTVADIIESLEPRTFLLENVPNLAKDFRFDSLRRRLERLRYYYQYDLVEAADYGVPQYRKRLVLVASKHAMPRTSARPKRHKTVAEAIGHLVPPEFSDDWLHAHVKRRSPRVEDVIRHIPRDGGSRSSLPHRLVLPCHRRTSGFSDVYGRLAWDAPSNTITSGCTNPSKGRFLHPEQDRALTLREAALLQAFPLRYRFAQTALSNIALQIGNAIPPPLARAHGLALADTLTRVEDR